MLHKQHFLKNKLLASPFDLSPFFNHTKYHPDNGTGRTKLRLREAVSRIVLQILAGSLICCKVSLKCPSWWVPKQNYFSNDLCHAFGRVIAKQNFHISHKNLLNCWSSLCGSDGLISCCFLTCLYKMLRPSPIHIPSVLAHALNVIANPSKLLPFFFIIYTPKQKQ